MTEIEFYKLKIFEKKSVIELRKQNVNITELINSWYCSEKYNEIQKFKSFIQAKFKQIKTTENISVELSNDEIYELFEWYEKQPKNCYYCNLPESELENLHSMTGHVNKRYPKRGKSLELDRKISSLPYTEFDNLVLACYWCNNAKTDTFTEKEFQKIGHEFRKIWENRLDKVLE